MKTKKFGSTALTVSEIGFGTARIGGVFAQTDKDEPVRLLQQAFDEGITFFDTADMYSQGESEMLLGRAFRHNRDKVVIASKGGYQLPTQRQLIAKIKPLVRPLIKLIRLKRESLPTAVTGTVSQDFSSGYLQEAVEGSLRRLNTDYIDLYQVHSPSGEEIQRGEFIEALMQLQQQGKIRYFGIAVDTVEDALLCLQYPQIASIQVPFGLLDLEAMQTLFARAEAQGTAIIARGCYGGGLLKPSLTLAELQEITPKWEQIVAYQQVAERHKRPLMEMALHFPLSLSPVTVTLLGMRTPRHLSSNLDYYQSGPLSKLEFDELVAAGAIPLPHAGELFAHA